MTLTPDDIGLLITIGSIAAYIGGGLPIPRTIGIIVGPIIMAENGNISRFLHWGAMVTGWAQSATNGLVGWGFGVTVPGLLALALAAKVAWDLYPQGGKVDRKTFWAALGLSIMIATASTNVTFLNNIGPQISHGVSTVQGG